MSAECDIHGCDLKHDLSCAECDLEAKVVRLLAALKELADLLFFDSPVEAGRENGWNFSDTTLINAAIAEARAAIKEAEGK